MKPYQHIVFTGQKWKDCALDCARILHFPEYEDDRTRRTRLTVVLDNISEVHDFVFEYQELFDNSFRRIVDLSGEKPSINLHRPQYEGKRKDFVDIEWEFVIGRFSHPVLQYKLRKWSNDDDQKLIIVLCSEEEETNSRYLAMLNRRLPANVYITDSPTFLTGGSLSEEELTALAKYLHYCYQVSYKLKHVPTELPQQDVDREWDLISDESQKQANIYNVMSIPLKMEILGHDRSSWDTFFALTANEIERLTAVEHNRWCVERLIQGLRPCNDTERDEIREDMNRRLTDKDYAASRPDSLKKIYKSERGVHYDLCAFSELGADETGLPVTRYDRDLTAAIPLIVKTFNDRRNG